MVYVNWPTVPHLHDFLSAVLILSPPVTGLRLLSDDLTQETVITVLTSVRVWSIF